MNPPIPAAAIEKHIAVVGKTGSGKTYAAKSIVERLVAGGRQVCVIDPTSAWWGLRLGRDGKCRGLERIVIIGGEKADVPLAPRSGEAVALLVTQQGASVVIDTGGLGVGEYTQWFTDFASALYRTIKAPLHLVIDEAHQFMPQAKVPDPQASRMLHAGNRLMSGGRSRGIRAMLITQRPAKLHKDSLTCADTLVAMRVLAPQDRSAVKDWIDGCGDQVQGKKVLDSLAQLQCGEGWVWFPEGGHLERVKFPRITTYDSSAAPTHGGKDAPKPGEIDLTEVSKALAEAVKEAEANDPKRLRAEISRLQSELSKASKTQLAPRAAAPTGVPTKTIQSVARVVGIALDKCERAIEVARSAMEIAPATKFIREQLASITKDLPVAGSSAGAAVAIHAPRQQASRAPSSGEMVGGGLRRMLIALAQRPQGLSAEQLGIRAGMRNGSGTWTAYLGRARRDGWIEGTSDRLRITDAGLASLGEFDPLPTGAELLAYWSRELGGGAARMLNALADVYPDSMTGDQLGAAAEITTGSGTFTAYLGRLRRLELVTGRSDALRASDELFDGGGS